MGTVSFDFKGEIVVVTGGSRGLGLEIAYAFGQAGAKVVITARREQWLKEAENFLKDQDITVHALTCDVADAASVEQTVQTDTSEKCGKIDVLVNNAGLTWGAPAETMPLRAMAAGYRCKYYRHVSHVASCWSTHAGAQKGRYCECCLYRWTGRWAVEYCWLQFQ